MANSDRGDVTAGQLTRTLAPIHKLAFGIAVGLVAGVLLFIVTLGHAVMNPPQSAYLALLGQYFYGYTVSPAGAFVGLFWGFVTGFVAGWFLGFVCNVTVALTIFALRTRAERAQTSDFLDHL